MLNNCKKERRRTHLPSIPHPHPTSWNLQGRRGALSKTEPQSPAVNGGLPPDSPGHRKLTGAARGPERCRVDVAARREADLVTEMGKLSLRRLLEVTTLEIQERDGRFRC